MKNGLKSLVARAHDAIHVQPLALKQLHMAFIWRLRVNLIDTNDAGVQLGQRVCHSEIRDMLTRIDVPLNRDSEY